MKKNLAQEEVINNIYGQMIVIACPGSGKTTTLLRRIHHMVEDEFIDYEDGRGASEPIAVYGEVNTQGLMQTVGGTMAAGFDCRRI